MSGNRTRWTASPLAGLSLARRTCFSAGETTPAIPLRTGNLRASKVEPGFWTTAVELSFRCAVEAGLFVPVSHCFCGRVSRIGPVSCTGRARSARSRASVLPRGVCKTDALPPTSAPDVGPVSCTGRSSLAIIARAHSSFLAARARHAPYNKHPHARQCRYFVRLLMNEEVGLDAVCCMVTPPANDRT